LERKVSDTPDKDFERGDKSDQKAGPEYSKGVQQSCTMRCVHILMQLASHTSAVKHAVRQQKSKVDTETVRMYRTTP
jgi:hypothetical protein